mgnify:CR=1 FL=1
MLNCKNIIINGHRTSMRLDHETWESLKEICQREKISMNDLCSHIFRIKGQSGLSAATRLFVLVYYRWLLNKYETPTFKFPSEYHPALIFKCAA